MKKTEGVLFQDSQDLVVKGCENNTVAQAVREIVNRGINGTVKRALKLSATPNHFTEVRLSVEHSAPQDLLDR